MLNDQVKISVIIPVKNGEKTIQKTRRYVYKHISLHKTILSIQQL